MDFCDFVGDLIHKAIPAKMRYLNLMDSPALMDVRALMNVPALMDSPALMAIDKDAFNYQDHSL